MTYLIDAAFERLNVLEAALRVGLKAGRNEADTRLTAQPRGLSERTLLNIRNLYAGANSNFSGAQMDGLTLRCQNEMFSILTSAISFITLGLYVQLQSNPLSNCVLLLGVCK
jgi:hypothetical protein